MELPLCVGHLIYRPAAAGGGLLIAVYLFKITLFFFLWEIQGFDNKVNAYKPHCILNYSIDLTGNASAISRFKIVPQIIVK